MKAGILNSAPFDGFFGLRNINFPNWEINLLLYLYRRDDTVHRLTFSISVEWVVHLPFPLV